MRAGTVRETEVGARRAKAPFALLITVAVSGLLPVSHALADPAGDERYLALEGAQRAYRDMVGFASMRWPVLEVEDTPEGDALRARGQALAAEVFSPERAMAEFREALASQPGEVPEEIAEITERMRVLEAQDAARDPAELVEDAAAAQARYEARADRDRIDAVSEAMARPDLAGETAVTGLRVKWIYEPLLTGSDKQLRAMSEQEIEAGVEDLLQRSRTLEGFEGAPPLRRELMRETSRQAIRSVLSRMPEADVATLAAFYASDAARAKREALLARYRTRSDEDAARFMRILVEEARAKAP